MNKYTLFTGAVCMCLMGLFGDGMAEHGAVGLGLMWMGLSVYAQGK